MKMPRKSLKLWLASTNGWQRIWFVCSVICFLYYTIFYPLEESGKGRAFRYEMLWAAEKEMKNPLCAPYMSGDFEKLIVPQYSTDGSTCYHIYSHRKHSEDRKPITEAMYQEDFSRGEREKWLIFIGMGAFISTLLIAFSYGVGVVVSWILKGFKRNDSK